jgi:hypothetical protein
MSKNSCTHETLVNSKYCTLVICRECGVIHFNLPYRISLQFEVMQFLEIADAFTHGARRVRKAETGSIINKAKVVELKKIIH